MAKSDVNTTYALSLISGILILLNGLVLVLLLGLFGAIMTSATTTLTAAGAPFIGLVMWLIVVAGLVAIVFGILIIWASTWIKNKKKRRDAYIMVLVLSIIGIATGGGFIIGSILGIVAGALGLSGN